MKFTHDIREGADMYRVTLHPEEASARTHFKRRFRTFGDCTAKTYTVLDEARPAWIQAPIVCRW